MARTNERQRVVVIGGGVSGLAAAHQLTEMGGSNPPFDVLLLEASNRIGGTVRTHHREGFLLEGGPDAFVSEKPEALELAKRIGLGPQLIETNESHRRSFVVRRGRLHPTPEGFQLLAPTRLWPFVISGIFSWAGKARMALDLILPRRAHLDKDTDESLAAFVRRRLGREALERMAQPMVGGIYTADPEKLSLRATMPRFLEMERAHRSLILAMRRSARVQRRNGDDATRGVSGARYSLFLSFKDGMQTLTDALAAHLPEGCVRLNTRVERMRFDGESRRWILATNTGESISAAGVVVALPAYAAANLLRETDAVLADELDAISYASTATINLAYRREDIPHPLDGFGFVVPHAERRATLACSFSSVKFAGRAPEGHALLRAFVGGALQPEMFGLNEEQIVEAVRRDLRELLGVERAPLFTHVEKWPHSMAQYHVGHIERVARIRERLRALPTLRLAGNAYEGAGIPDCVRSGEDAAKHVLNVVVRSEAQK
jgi:protoporphyrinogen/coproporphyrinogen III oxidase